MHVSYHEGYRVDLPPTHPYPMGKYLLLRSVLDERGLSQQIRYVEPTEVSLDDLQRVHTPAYLERLQTDALTPAERRALGIPFTPRLWRRSRLTVEGTCLAAAAALSASRFLRPGGGAQGKMRKSAESGARSGSHMARPRRAAAASAAVRGARTSTRSGCTLGAALPPPLLAAAGGGAAVASTS